MCKTCMSPPPPPLGKAAHSVLQWSLSLHLLHLFVIGNWHAKTEYVQNLSVTLAVSHPWMGNSLGCLFAEDVGEALLSRLCARVKLHPIALEQPALMDLFLTVTHTHMGPKNLRGNIRSGFYDLLWARLRRLLAWCTGPHFLFAPFTTTRTTTLVGPLPEGFKFLKAIPKVDEVHLKKVFPKGILLLLLDKPTPDGVAEYLD